LDFCQATSAINAPGNAAEKHCPVRVGPYFAAFFFGFVFEGLVVFFAALASAISVHEFRKFSRMPKGIASFLSSRLDIIRET
jgi:hypothetical protein